jgi:enamine deaminase RidA (YjgF/YER057c/UK114 family)
VIRVAVYLRDLADRPRLNDAWEAFFPDPSVRPPHKYLPANLPEGVNVALGVLALAGSRREVLEVPGLVHGDPMSLGVRAGNVVTSSRLFAHEGELAEQFETLLVHAQALLGAAGGSLDDLVQATFFVGTEQIADDVAARAAAQWQPDAPQPVVHVREVDLGSPDGFPRLEILGLIND